MTGKKETRGAKPGSRNNPSGRPKGATNKIQTTIKNKIVDFITEDFDGFIDELKLLKPADLVKAKIELIKLVVPRPLNEEEKGASAIQSEFMKRLFGERKD